MKKFIKSILLVCVYISVNLIYNLFGCVGYGCFDFERNKSIKGFVVCAESENSGTYAKALANCQLYKTKEMSSNLEDVYFQVPVTYFVLILETINEDCFKVQYDRYVGYVESLKVEVATFVPIVKILKNITFDIKETSGTQIWKYPTTQSNVCTMVSAGTKGLKYIASTNGSVPSGGKSNTWYYVCYTSDLNSTNVYEGYVYSENVTNLSEIVANTETNPVVISEEQEMVNKNDGVIFISSTLKTIVISIIAIPIILFFAIILYKIIKKIKNNTKYDKNIKDKKLLPEYDFDKNQNLKSIEKYKNLRLVKNKNILPDSDDFNDEELL